MQAKPVAMTEAVWARLFWLLPLSFYLLTVSPTPGWVDAPLIAKTTYHVELSTWVNNHNLFTLVGSAWLHVVSPPLDPHYALNVLCAILGALTVHVVFLVGLALTRSVVASALGGAVLMVSHSLWWHSTMLEVYTLNTLLLALILLFVVRYEQEPRLRTLCSAALCLGLGCSNHPQMALVGLGFAGLAVAPGIRRDLVNPKQLVALFLCFLVGFQIYVWVFVVEFIGHLRSTPKAEPWVVFRVMLDRTTGGDFKRYMFPSGLSLNERSFWASLYAGLLIYNFPPPWLLAAPAGAVAWIRRKDARTSFGFFLLVLVAQVVWSANYLVWDMYAFSLPTYVLVGVLIIVGVDWALRRGRTLRRATLAMSPTLLLVPFLYHQAPMALSGSSRALSMLGRLQQFEQASAFWDPLTYFFDPNKRNYSRVQRYADTLESSLEPEACFWGSEATMLYPLSYYYQGVLGHRSDVKYNLVFGIVEGEDRFRRHANEMVRQLRDGCPVYVSSLGYPERDVLNLVYATLRPDEAQADIERMTTRSFTETFPEYRLDPVDVDVAEGVRVYRLEPRSEPPT